LAFKNNLVVLKNLSELMNDLAYSAVFLHDRRLAEQVHTVYKTFMDSHHAAREQLYSMNIPEPDFDYLSKLLVYMKELATNAVFIAQLSHHKNVPKDVLHALQKSDKRVIEEVVHFSSFFVGKAISELRIETYTKAHIICVKRRDEWIFSIDKDFCFQPNDVIIAIGTAESERLFRLSVNKSKV